MKIDKKQIPAAVILLFVLFPMIIIGIRNNRLIEEDIEANKIEGVALVEAFDRVGKGSDIYTYTFYYNGLRICNERTDDFDGEECVGKYYKVEFSAKNPKNSRLLLDQEITDKEKMINPRDIASKMWNIKKEYIDTR